MMTHRLWPIWLLPACLATPACAQMVLVRDGRPVAVVVVPDQALPVVSAAAEELRDHVRLATGAELTIVKESEAGQGGRVYLGPTRAAAEAGFTADGLPANGWRIVPRGADLFVLGDDTDGPAFWIQHTNRTRVGTLFGVYDLLEHELGARWLWPGELGTVIRTGRDLSLALTAERRGQPPLFHARWRDGGAPSAGPQGWARPEDRSRFLNEQGKWLRRHRFAMALNMDMAHAYTDWWTRFGESHPEYFNLLPDGTRRSDPLYHGGASSLISMCVSEPGVRRQKVADWAARRTAMAPNVDASENDTPGKCVCDRCLALDEPDPDSGVPFDQRLAVARRRYAAGEADWVTALGSLSDRYARFYVALQQEAEKIDPEAVVMGYSYANYVTPPRKTKLNERIIIGIVPALMYPWTEAKRQSFREQWDGWRAAGARLFLRPNYMLDGHNLPIFVARKLGEDFRYAARSGLIGTDFDSLTGQYATQGPNLYMLARLHDDPRLTVGAVLDEYYSAFGPAADAVRAYFEHWERVSDAVTDEQYQGAGLHWSRCYTDADTIFTEPVMAEGRRLMDTAVQAARGDPPAARRVAVLDDGLRDVELTLAAQRAYRRYREAGDLPAYAAALAAVDEHRARLETTGAVNVAYLAWAESRTWDRDLVKLMATPGQRLPDPWKFAFDPDDQGLAEHWFADDHDSAGWLDTGTNSAWETQPPGVQWKAEHRADYDGIAWYRTTFTVPAGEAAAQVRLVFGAVDEAAKVWVNGTLVCERPYPFQGNADSWKEAFEIDISHLVRRDRPNTLTVRVEDRMGAGGVWKPVWLVTSPAPAAHNAIRDGGFEDGSDAWRKSVMAGTVALDLDDQVTRSGRVSARLTATALGSDAVAAQMRTAVWARWYQTGVPVRAGATYRLRAWVRTASDFRGTLGLWVTGTTKGTASVQALNTGGTWRQVSLDGIVPAGDQVAVYLNLRDNLGTVWFDDVELAEVTGE